MARPKKFENRTVEQNFKAGKKSLDKHDNKLLINAMINTGIKSPMFSNSGLTESIKAFIGGWFSRVHPDPKNMDLDKKYQETKEVFTNHLTN